MKKILFIVSFFFYTFAQQCSDRELVMQCLQSCAELSVNQAKEKIVTLLQDVAGDDQEKFSKLRATFSDWLAKEIMELNYCLESLEDEALMLCDTNIFSKIISASWLAGFSGIAAAYFSYKDLNPDWVYKKTPAFEALTNYTLELVNSRTFARIECQFEKQSVVSVGKNWLCSKPMEFTEEDKVKMQKCAELYRSADLERPALGEKIIESKDNFNTICALTSLAVAGVATIYVLYQLSNQGTVHDQRLKELDHEIKLYAELLNFVQELQINKV